MTTPAEAGLNRQPGRVGEAKPAVEGAKLRPRQILVAAVGVRRPADHEYVSESRLQLDRDVDRPFQVHRQHDAGRLSVQDRGLDRRGHDRRARKQLVSICIDELERDISGRNDHVEGLPRIFPPEKITDRRLVVGLGKARDIQIFGVVIELSGQAVVENCSNSVVNVQGHRRTPLQGDEHQHGFLGTLGGRDQAKHSHHRAHEEHSNSLGSRHAVSSILSYGAECPVANGEYPSSKKRSARQRISGSIRRHASVWHGRSHRIS